MLSVSLVVVERPGVKLSTRNGQKLIETLSTTDFRPCDKYEGEKQPKKKVTRIRGIEPRAAALKSPHDMRGGNVSHYTISELKH